MSHARHSEPLPLGTPDHPYSKGLMARALVAVGVPLGRAYELAKRIDQDLVERAEQSVELDRVEELALEVLGEEEGSEALRRLRRFRELHEFGIVSGAQFPAVSLQFRMARVERRPVTVAARHEQGQKKQRKGAGWRSHLMFGTNGSPIMGPTLCPVHVMTMARMKSDMAPWRSSSALAQGLRLT